ncbi:Hypothetical protein FKW44_013524 [Caligus rogercresseyi]|uniref:Uncharacterized protein n=1 Tax=Caligus rogercresseyi TaxID=217165 RepID=A0A7T8JZR4_CALRO|nr:Hypothetical protein FKW44_013524 [Caligus rogercresseyi]
MMSRGPYEPSKADFSRLGRRRGTGRVPSTEIPRERRSRHPISWGSSKKPRRGTRRRWGVNPPEQARGSTGGGGAGPSQDLWRLTH